MTQPLVYKLGGSSVSSPSALLRFAQSLANEKTHPVLVVVSAFSKVTDQLIALSQAVKDDQREEVKQRITSLRARHLQIVTQLFDYTEAPNVAQALSERFTALEAICHALPSHDHFTARETDQIIRFGEALSSIVASALIRQEAGNCKLLLATDLLVTDNNFGEAEPCDTQTREKVNLNLRPYLQPGHICLTQGFCGATPNGHPTTLGRGGSDFSATYLAYQIGAKIVEIRTDTRGVLSADPRIVPDAHTLPNISREQALYLARFGAKVLHQRCIEPLIDTDIIARVCSSFDPEDPGTLIGQECTGNSSITACQGVLLTCNEEVETQLAEAALQHFQQEAAHHLLSHQNQEKFQIAFTQKPEPGHPLEEKDHRFIETDFIFALSKTRDDHLLNELIETLQSHNIPLKGAYADAIHGGYVFITDRQDRQDAITLLHKNLYQPLPA